MHAAEGNRLVSPVEQLICAHCTKESSALIRSTGANRNEIAGYSVRSTSFETDLAIRFEQVRPFFHYQLPDDVSESDRSLLSERDAPRRLFYDKTEHESVIGHVVYQHRDATGHAAGSYLAHFLMLNNQPSSLDVLALWGAPRWIEKVQPLEELPHNISSLPSLDCLWNCNDNKPIDIQVISDFLTVDNCVVSVVPDRWRRESASSRQRLLQVVLGELMSALADDQDLIVVAEPEFAALLFFGALLFLPQSGFANRISFSTYEHDAVGSKYQLTATCAQSVSGFRKLATRVRDSHAHVIDTSDLSHETHRRLVGTTYSKEVMSFVLSSSQEMSGPHLVNRLSEFHKEFGTFASDGPRTIDCLAAMINIVRRATSALGSAAINSERDLQIAIEKEFHQRFDQNSISGEVFEHLRNTFRSWLERELSQGQKVVDAFVDADNATSIRFVLRELTASHTMSAGCRVLLRKVASKSGSDWKELVGGIIRDDGFQIKFTVLVLFWDKLSNTEIPHNKNELFTQTRKEMLEEEFDSAWLPAFLIELVEYAKTGSKRCRSAVEILIVEMSDRQLCKFCGTNGSSLLKAVNNDHYLSERFKRMLESLERTNSRQQLNQTLSFLEMAKEVIGALPSGRRDYAFMQSLRRLLDCDYRGNRWWTMKSILTPIMVASKQSNRTRSGANRRTQNDDPYKDTAVVAKIAMQVGIPRGFTDRLNSYWVKHHNLSEIGGSSGRFRIWYWWKCLSDIFTINWRQLRLVPQTLLFIMTTFLDLTVICILSVYSALTLPVGFDSIMEAFRLQLGILWEPLLVRLCLIVVTFIVTQAIALKRNRLAKGILYCGAVLLACITFFRIAQFFGSV